MWWEVRAQQELNRVERLFGGLGWVYCRGEDVMPPVAHPSLPSAVEFLRMFSRNPNSCSGTVVEMVGTVQKLEVPSGEPEHPAGWAGCSRAFLLEKE